MRNIVTWKWKKEFEFRETNKIGSIVSLSIFMSFLFFISLEILPAKARKSFHSFKESTFQTYP